MTTKTEFVEILLDIALEERGRYEPRLEALALVCEYMPFYNVQSTRYPDVREVVGATLLASAKDTSASLQERMHAARLLSQHGYIQ